MISYRRIDIIKNISEACICVTLEKHYREFFRRSNPLQNCILDFLEPYIKDMSNDLTIRLVIYLTGNDDPNFLKTLHYNFSYRKQKEMVLPFEIDALTKKEHLVGFMDFLIDEHFNMLDRNELSYVPEILNPLYFINQNFFCIKTIIPPFLKKRLLFLPSI